MSVKRKGRDRLMEKTKMFLKSLWKNFANPRFLLCFGIGWMITNGWSYLLFFLGNLFSWKWAIAVSGFYVGLLRIPFTPEKIITFLIAIRLAKRLFPDDQKTLKELLETQKLV